MDNRPQIRVSIDAATGQFALRPVGQDGQASSDYVPELMKSPDILIYVFDEPEVLSSLLRGLTITSSSGRKVATGTLALMKTLRLDISEPRNMSHGVERNEEQKQQQTEVVQRWGKVLQGLPSGHRINEIQLDVRSQREHGLHDEDVEDLVEPLSSALVGKPNGGMKCVLVR